MQCFLCANPTTWSYMCANPTTWSLYTCVIHIIELECGWCMALSKRNERSSIYISFQLQNTPTTLPPSQEEWVIKYFITHPTPASPPPQPYKRNLIWRSCLFSTINEANTVSWCSLYTRVCLCDIIKRYTAFYWVWKKFISQASFTRRVYLNMDKKSYPIVFCVMLWFVHNPK